MVTWRWGLRCWWASRWRRRWWGPGWPRTRRRCRWTPRRRREAPANTVIHYRWDFLNEFLTLSFNWWFYFQDTYLAIMSVLCKRSKGGQYKQRRKCVCGKKGSSENESDYWLQSEGQLLRRGEGIGLVQADLARCLHLGTDWLPSFCGEMSASILTITLFTLIPDQGIKSNYRHPPCFAPRGNMTRTRVQEVAAQK